MNKSLEITKIKVNSFEELVSKTQEYKTSGGEWKLLESHLVVPCRPESGEEEKWASKNNKAGIVISNGEQKVDLMVEDREVINFNHGAQDKLTKIFPESNFWKMPVETGNTIGKEIKEGNKKLWLIRKFNAWSITNIFKLLVDYYQANKNQIGQSPDFDRWVKVKTHPGENYFSILVGKIDDNWEWEIIIKRSGLERCRTFNKDYWKLHGGYTMNWKDLSNQQMANELEWRIKRFWIDFLTESENGDTISQYSNYQVGFTNDNFEPIPRKNDNSIPEKKDSKPSPIKEKLLRNLDKISLDPIGWLSDAEVVKGNIEKDYYKGNSNWKEIEAKIHRVEIEGEEMDLVKLEWEDKSAIRKAIIQEIKQNPQDWKIEETNVYGEPGWFKVLRHKSGRRHWTAGIICYNESWEKGQKDWAEIEALLKGHSLPDQNQTREWEENQIIKYFHNNDIHTITLDGNNLVIKHNSGKVETLEVNSPQLKLIKGIVEQQKNHSLSFLDLQPATNSPQSNSNNHQLAIGLAVGAGAVILIGVMVYLFQKRNKK